MAEAAIIFISAKTHRCDKIWPMDRLDKATRSKVMSRIRAKDTKPEQTVRKYLHRCGLRFRLHYPKLPGRPDLAFPKHRVALFVHGCFWHFCRKCRSGRIPKSNRGYWAAKLKRNVARDKAKNKQLSRLGWKVMVVWECEISPRKLAGLARRIHGC